MKVQCCRTCNNTVYYFDVLLAAVARAVITYLLYNIILICVYLTHICKCWLMMYLSHNTCKHSTSAQNC